MLLLESCQNLLLFQSQLITIQLETQLHIRDTALESCSFTFPSEASKSAIASTNDLRTILHRYSVLLKSGFGHCSCEEICCSLLLTYKRLHGQPWPWHFDMYLRFYSKETTKCHLPVLTQEPDHQGNWKQWTEMLMWHLSLWSI